MYDLCAEKLLESEDRFVGRDGHRFFEFCELDAGTQNAAPALEYRSGELKEKEIESWIRKDRPVSGYVKTRLRVLLSPKPAGKPTSGRLPYTLETYRAISRAWRIPPMFLRAVAQKLSIVTQCSAASLAYETRGQNIITQENDEAEDRIQSSIYPEAQCLLIRGDVDWTWDYTLFLIHDPKTRTTCVLVVGLTAIEIDLVGSYMASLSPSGDTTTHKATASSSTNVPLQTHPLLLPILLLDLATDDTASLLELRAKLLSQIQQQTGMDRFNSLKSATAGQGSKRRGHSWERRELDLDQVMLRLTCLSDWVAAQRGFVGLQRRVVDVIGGVLQRGLSSRDGKNVVGSSWVPHEGVTVAEDAFRDRLAFIQESLLAAEQKCVYLERSISTQVQTIYSLIGQKDNRLSISATNASCQIASDSRRIAILTRRDSTDMRIIAAVTLLFLPGTFVATVFSTGMFDWGNGDPNASESDAGAEEGSSTSGGRTVSKYIWVYFMMTGILTFLVLVAWILFSWAQNRKMVRRFGLDVNEGSEVDLEGLGFRTDTGVSVQSAGGGGKLAREGTLWSEFERWVDEAKGSLRWWRRTRKESTRGELKSA